MDLKILLPFQVLVSGTKVSRIIAENSQGSFAILPRRLDCVAALVPGILIYETPEAGEVIVAIDEGILVKTGPDVLVSVRRGVVGLDLATIHDLVTREFSTLDEQELSVRAVMDRLESGFVRRLATFQND